MSGSRVAHRRALPLAVTLAATLLAGLLPVPGAVASDPITADPATAASSLPGPSVVYLDAMAHEGDRIDFRPGGRVDVPFTPRGDDRWPVGGTTPVDLPAGRTTGREMARSPNGSQWTAGDPRPAGHAGATGGPDSADAPIDMPAGGSALDASAAAYTQPGIAVTDAAAASGLRRQVFGFLPYWQLSGAASKLNLDVLSTIAYFSVGVSRSGDLKKRSGDGSATSGWAGWTSSSMTSVINQAHRHGTRVVLTVTAFAWTSSQARVQRAVLGSSSSRLKLARQVAAAVRDRGADGVNLDFEPLASGYEDEFVALLRTVRSELNRIRRGYQLTYDTTGYIGNYPLEASVGPRAADAIFVMGYDYRTGGSATAGSIDPLRGPKYDLADTVRAFTARVDPSRVILGLPWYGRAWSTTGSDPRARNRSGAKYGYSTSVTYATVAGLVKQYGRRWDPLELSPYVAYRRRNCTSAYGCVTSWRQVYYDDAASLQRRLALVNDYGLRGAGMWALGNDGGHPELYRAYATAFLVDKSAPQAGVRILSSTQRDEGFVVRWTATDTSRIVSYDVQVSVNGRAWTPWLTGTRSTSDVWLGADGTGYAFRVRARDSKGNTGAWNVSSTWAPKATLARGGFGRVTTDGLAYRAGPDTSAARLGRLRAGTIVAITRGPVSADGYRWFEITQPVREWSPVSFVERGVWVAASSATRVHVAAYRAPNSTRVAAALSGLDFGTGSSAVGTGRAAVAARAFSPDGDGSRDGIRLRWTNTRAMDSLVLRVFRAGGRLLGSVRVPSLTAGAHTFVWNGRVGGSRVRDGRYVLQLVGKAGTRAFTAPSVRPTSIAQVRRYAVTVDTVDPVRTASSATTTRLSPNGDGRLETTRLSLAAGAAVRWTARITNDKGSVVRSATRSARSGSLTWDGRDNAGARLPDGRYRATLAAWDAAGNSTSRSWTLTLDTAGPSIVPAASPVVVSPNRDGVADRTVLGWTSDEPATGTVRLFLGSNRVRRWTVTSASTWSARWAGRRDDGRTAPDGRYTLRVSLRDAAGNRRTTSTSLIVDRTVGSLAWSNAFYPQDGDALRGTARIGWRLTRDATTTLRVYDASGRLVRSVWKGRSQHAGGRGWTWNGKDGSGRQVAQGRYTARLTVRSPFSTQVLQQPVVVAAFAVTTSASRVSPGQALVVRFSSVEPLSDRPIVRFKQPGRAATRAAARRQADGTYKATFRVRTGSAGAGRVKVSATDARGGRNVTLVPIRISGR